MAGKLAALPQGTRITDYVSLEVITKILPLERIHRVLRETGRTSVRQCASPAHVMVYFVAALVLDMRCPTGKVLRRLLEGGCNG